MVAASHSFVILNVRASSRLVSPIDYVEKCGKPYRDPSFFVIRIPGTMNEFYKNIKEEQVPAPKILRKICIEACQNMLVINQRRVLALFAESCRHTRL